MSDYVPDSNVPIRMYCPTCEPTADPQTELLDVFWCERHTPSREGVLDKIVNTSQYLSGSNEAGGEDNKAFCDFIHRGKTNA